MPRITISGVGWSCMDYLFTKLDFSSEGFKKYESRTPGDGGTSPGHLVFKEDLEKFSGVSIDEVRKCQNWYREPDVCNIGGPCVVALINAAQLMENNDAIVRLFGAVGNDATADRILSMVGKTPVNLDNVQRMPGSSPYTLCLSDPNYNEGKGERSFVVNKGVFGDYTIDMINDSFFESDILYFGATALAPRIHKKLTTLLRKGKERGCINVVGTVFDFPNEKENPNKRWPMGESDESFALMDLLVMDWDETMKISGEKTIENAMNFFIQKGVKSVVVTHGHLDSYAWSSGTLFKEMELTAFPVSTQALREISENKEWHGDTTGCGDNFAGGLLASIAKGLSRGLRPGELSLTEALSWAHASGAFACFYVGGLFLESQPGEKLRKVKEYRKSYKKQMGLQDHHSCKISSKL
ncbi:carbohydrate kinase [Trypanosoma theileri]|uniref:Carbohydrate kinase n=1 Tax=Trypanosoma theileri TaxID=67003 RepID=A0A1X0NPL1_9TRYP|nr:carbohydrate kinase [Trypanosoma theileri]ORC86646.1 carbohydrate kinase [Trypanosoma theileri]